MTLSPGETVGVGRGEGGGEGRGDEGREIKTKNNQLKKVMIVGFSELGCPAAKPQQRI